MEKEYLTILLHLSLAVLAGGLIGLERTYHGTRPGFAPTRWCVRRPAC